MVLNRENRTTVCNAEVGGGAVVQGTAPQAGRSRVRFLKGSLGIFIDLILPAAL
jgi:hypothetical protein